MHENTQGPHCLASFQAQQTTPRKGWYLQQIWQSETAQTHPNRNDNSRQSSGRGYTAETGLAATYEFDPRRLDFSKLLYQKRFGGWKKRTRQ
jgi:hypothetical protein